LDPDFRPSFANTFEFIRDVFTTVQLRPELLVAGTALVIFVHKHAVLFFFDLVPCIAERLQEVLVGRYDGSIHLKFDDGLRFANGRDLSGVVGVLQFLLGNVDRILDHLEGLSIQVHDGVVRGLDPDFFASFADTLEFVGHVLAAV